jgi:hypothetical protein
MTSKPWPSDRLRNLERVKSLTPEPTSPEEIESFIEAGRAHLNDARTVSLSVLGRFQLAYMAAHAFALAGLRANDLRTAAREGHRVLLFQVLPDSVGASQGVSLTLVRAHAKRNEAEYAGIVDTTESQVADLIKVTDELEATLAAWLRSHRPELIA